MCGIHGVITAGKPDINADDYVSSGFVAGSLRGVDSAGIASIDTTTYKVDYHKLAIPGPVFVDNKRAKTLIGKARIKDTLSICHTRAATQGGVNYDTAHPFLIEEYDGSSKEERTLIGVHNGTLTGWSYKQGARGFSVDSEWALNNIFDKGEEAFKDFAGPYCFVWWDSKDKDNLNIALNNGRPMAIGFTESGNMVYASEAGMLFWLCERHSIKLDGPVLHLQADHWYKFPVDEPKKYSKSKLPAPVSTYTPTYNTTRSNYKSNVDRVNELLAEISKSVDAQPDTVKQGQVLRNASVTREEIQNARDLSLMSKKAIFEPIYKDKGDNTICGNVYLQDETEFVAEIRNCQHINYKATDKWHVSIIGAYEYNNEITLVCSKPKGDVLPEEEKKVATVH